MNILYPLRKDGLYIHNDTMRGLNRPAVPDSQWRVDPPSEFRSKLVRRAYLLLGTDGGWTIGLLCQTNSHRVALDAVGA